MPGGQDVLSEVEGAQQRVYKDFDDDAETLIAEARYGYIAGALRETVQARIVDRAALSDKIDRVLTNKLLAFPLFLGFMWLLFQTTFTLGTYPMEWIESGIGALGSALGSALPPGNIRDLLVEGIIGGVGGVVVFLPNILILFLEYPSWKIPGIWRGRPLLWISLCTLWACTAGCYPHGDGFWV